MSEQKHPHLIGNDRACMIVAISKCPECGSPMIEQPPRYLTDYDGLFTLRTGSDFFDQIKEMGVRIRSHVTVNDKRICADCAAAGKARFLCALCQKEKPTNRIHESYGEPPEHLCEDCFETVPAKVWHKKAAELHDAHSWDFE